MCFMEKISVFDKLHSGMTDLQQAVGHEFNVKESAIYIN